ncbi:Ubiquitin carboxyl-terminal hydrolase 33 [Borealophlyctis nickersoniae]|nr:Ubiquitin carboxyl-terminal hydrolase 33 [Borealophlyctis nickersoniae]
MSKLRAFLDLPSELLSDIVARYLAAKDAITLSQTCSKLYRIADDPLVWKSLCYRFKKADVCPSDMSWKDVYRSDFSTVCPHILDITPDITSERATAYGACDSRILQCTVEGCEVLMPDLWFCLTKECSHIGCGRTKGKHAYQHHHVARHALTIKMNTLEVWCYGCRKWVGVVDAHPVERAKLRSIAGTFVSRSAAALHCDADGTLNARRQRERDAYPFTYRDALCFVAADWLTEWKAFLLGNSGPPGPIDNSALLVDGMFDPDARPNADFGFISRDNWNMLRDIYGGGPEVSVDHLLPERHEALIGLIAFWRRFPLRPELDDDGAADAESDDDDD